MKKIIFVHLLNDRSGSPKVLAQVIATARNLAFETETLTSAHKNGFLDNSSGLVKNIFYQRSENKFITLAYYLFSQVVLFLNCLRYRNQDVLFYVNTMMPFGAAVAAKIIRKEVIYHIHETSISPALLKLFLRGVISVAASKVVFVSDYLFQQERFGNKKQYVIHNALDFNIKNKSVKCSDEIFNVLMVCSLKTYKGIPEFFNIAESLLSNTIVRFTLVLNAEQEELTSWFTRLSVPSNVRLFSKQADVSRFYAVADILVNLSRPDECIETFGLTILEGMAHGLPVIVPPVGGPSEIVSDGVEGFLISSYQTKDIADVIEKLISDPEYYFFLSENAKKRANDFSFKRFEEKIEQVLNK